MSTSLNRTSTLVAHQLPQFIRDDHPKFVEFLEKYYEFLEQPGNPIYEMKRAGDNYDVDLISQSLLTYFKSKILPSFPEKTELTMSRIIKASREFYNKKGTPDSFKFLFRALYNTEIELFFPKLQILKASDGKWVQPQAFRLVLSPEYQGFDLGLIENRKAVGSISQASCIIETANLTIDKSTGREIVEIYVSNVNRTFQNGEYLQVNYVDSSGVAGVFSEKIIGALSNIKINPKYRGSKYHSGDPIIISGGLDETSNTKVTAQAQVGNVTTGSIDSVLVFKGGYGYSLSPNTMIEVISTSGIGANLSVLSVDSTNTITLNYCTDSILLQRNYPLSGNFVFSNTTITANINVNSKLVDAFSYSPVGLSSISQIDVINGGSFFDQEPSLKLFSLYDNDYSTGHPTTTVFPGDFINYNSTSKTLQLVNNNLTYSSENDFYTGWMLQLEKEVRIVIGYVGSTKTLTLDNSFERNITINNIYGKTFKMIPKTNVGGMGYIAAIEIVSGGRDYAVGETLSFIGTGYGATATISSISGSGAITGINLSNRGEGYPDSPTVIINTTSGNNAALIAHVFGSGESLEATTSDIGSVQDIVVTNRGSDYISTPNVSLKVYDLYTDPLTFIPPNTEIKENDLVYQTTDAGVISFNGTVNSHDKSNNIIRVFNYSQAPKSDVTLYITRGGYPGNPSSINIASTIIRTKSVDIFDSENSYLYTKIYPWRYGDGTAKVTATFLNGLIKYNGYYLGTDGQPSSDMRLQDSNRYHNFSYGIISNIPYSEYSKSILDIAHPAGTKLVPIQTIELGETVSEYTSINVDSLILSTNTLIGTCNVVIGSNAIVGGTNSEHFNTVASVGDKILINPNAPGDQSTTVTRKFLKTITKINGANSIEVDSPIKFIGDGRIDVSKFPTLMNLGVNFSVYIYHNAVNPGTQPPLTVAVELDFPVGIDLSYLYDKNIRIVYDEQNNYYFDAYINDFDFSGGYWAMSGFLNYANIPTSFYAPYGTLYFSVSLAGPLGLVISNNTNSLVNTVSTGDIINFNVGSGNLLRSVISVTGNTIALNNMIGLVSSTNINAMYQVFPKMNVVDYEIMKTNYVAS